mmetsp:Transcript_12563/g.39084  ORF Transcript_12563/g.39084 Transcript_12563/m.39084 type:complete len:266 (-) Transcript_12563:71-868(-)
MRRLRALRVRGVPLAAPVAAGLRPARRLPRHRRPRRVPGRGGGPHRRDGPRRRRRAHELRVPAGGLRPRGQRRRAPRRRDPAEPLLRARVPMRRLPGAVPPPHRRLQLAGNATRSLLQHRPQLRQLPRSHRWPELRLRNVRTAARRCRERRRTSQRRQLCAVPRVPRPPREPGARSDAQLHGGLGGEPRGPADREPRAAARPRRAAVDARALAGSAGPLLRLRPRQLRQPPAARLRRHQQRRRHQPPHHVPPRARAAAQTERRRR